MPNIFSRPTKMESVSLNRGSAPAGVDSALWNANPYANFDYKHSRWQQFLEGLGFRTNYDAYKESMALQAAEYDAQVAEQTHNEEYDSAVEQANRLRAAGINPDLNGSVDAGSSSPMQPDNNPPVAPESDYNQISQFGSVVMDAVQMASGIASGGMNIVQQFADLRGKKISNDNKWLSLISDATLAVTNPSKRDNFPQTGDESIPVNYQAGLAAIFGNRRAKRIMHGVNRFATGLSSTSREAGVRNKMASDWIGLHDQTAGDGWSMFDSTMKEVRHALSTQLFENLKASSSLEGQKIQDESQYFGARQNKNQLGQTMPEVQALNESQSLTYGNLNQQADYSLKQRNLALRNTFEGLVKKLNGMADNGNWFAGLVSVGLSYLGSKYLGM